MKYLLVGAGSLLFNGHSVPSCRDALLWAKANNVAPVVVVNLQPLGGFQPGLHAVWPYKLENLASALDKHLPGWGYALLDWASVGPELPSRNVAAADSVDGQESSELPMVPLLSPRPPNDWILEDIPSGFGDVFRDMISLSGGGVDSAMCSAGMCENASNGGGVKTSYVRYVYRRWWNKVNDSLSRLGDDRRRIDSKLWGTRGFHPAIPMFSAVNATMARALQKDAIMYSKRGIDEALARPKGCAYFGGAPQTVISTPPLLGPPLIYPRVNDKGKKVLGPSPYSGGSFFTARWLMEAAELFDVRVPRSLPSVFDWW